MKSIPMLLIVGSLCFFVGVYIANKESMKLESDLKNCRQFMKAKTLQDIFDIPTEEDYNYSVGVEKEII